MSRRLRVWGAVGGLIGGVAFAAGHVVGFAGGGAPAAAMIAGWLNLGGVVALVFTVVSMHEALGDRGGIVADIGAIAAVVGFTLLAGFFTLRIALAYELIPREATGAAPIVVLSVVANVSLLLGLLFLGVELLRSEELPRFVGIAFLLATGAFVIGFFGVPIAGTLGALFLGAGAAGAAAPIAAAARRTSLRGPH